MIAERWAVLALRVFLVILFGILVVFETLSIPGKSVYEAQQNPDDTLRLPLTIIAIFWVVCVQVIVVATWKLLTLVRKDEIFTEAALKWVNVILWAIAAAWVVLVAVFLWVGFNADDPGLPMVLFLLTTGVTVVGLLMIVMRALLQRATTLRADMEAVI